MLKEHVTEWATNPGKNYQGNYKYNQPPSCSRPLELLLLGFEVIFVRTTVLCSEIGVVVVVNLLFSDH